MLRTKDSVVGIVKRLQVEQSEVQIPGRKKASTHLQNVHSDPGDHLASCWIYTRYHFRWLSRRGVKLDAHRI